MVGHQLQRRLASSETVRNPGTPPAVPLNPNGRPGRTVNPLRQGRVAREEITVGIEGLPQCCGASKW